MKHSISLILLMAVVATGCGSPLVETEIKKPDNAREAGNAEESLKQLREADVYCGEAGVNCPNNVVMLNMRWLGDREYEVGTCSGTLVAEDLILTNAHCVPPGFKNNGSSCKDAIMAKFPRTKTGKAEKLDCIEVVQVFNEDKSQPDLAVIRIEKPAHKRDPIEIEKNRISHNQILTAFTMNPKFHAIYGMFGIIKKKTCKVSQDNVFYYKQDRTAGDMLITGSECKVIGGNSGSGVRNARGSLVGLIHSRLKIDNIETKLGLFRIENQKLGNAGAIVNLGCLKSLHVPLSQDCIMPRRTPELLSDYLDEKARDFRLNGLSEDRIKFRFNSDFSISLFNPDSDDILGGSLREARKNLWRVFFRKR